MTLRVALVSHRSLFAGGIASRLREYTDRVEVHELDAGQPGMSEGLHALAPDIVVVDAADAAMAEGLPVAQLLETLPNARVVLIDPHSGQVRVFSVHETRAEGIEEVIAVMQGLGFA